MKFGSVPLDAAEGAILAHSQRVADGVIRKGTALSADDVARLAAAGLTAVTVARLGAGDAHEDAAARAIADAVAGANVRVAAADTGRSNLYATAAGLAMVNEGAVHGLNAVDPALTLATLSPFRRVEAGEMVGTVKVIPFAAPEAHVAAAASAGAGSLGVAPWAVRRVAAISTRLPALKESVIDKTLKILAARLQGTGAELTADARVPHAPGALADAIRAADADLVVVFGASAVVDAGDVIPAAIVGAGGTVIHVGMPVDPGNLLVVGAVDGRPVIGAPGCARSPKLNGFDLVLDRLLAGLSVSGADIVRLGVGGLLAETRVRPRPRAAADGAAPRTVAGVILAAGRSRRMGAQNKLLAPVDGVPMVRRVAAAALAADLSEVVVVLGHEGAAVRDALAGLDVRFVTNPAYGEGVSTSVRAGIEALPAVDGAVVLLGDMPLVTGRAIDRVVRALGEGEATIAVATHGGVRGNPVAWSSAHFAALRALSGDQGGRPLFAAHAKLMVEVEIGEAAGADADTPEALAALNAR
ncbi:MAG: molybdopterin-binding/glycosyltransferase family 2 protein [Pseudomonadota bacterium]